ncbi:hypothetical protein BDR07DRAFT_1465502 [Suillus spraguei]|nr:hypothetical protein BDR07DRAFT_1465502 [Suillus spraguei]
MSPPAFRATFPGVAYQIGNMVRQHQHRLKPCILAGGDNLRTTIIKNGAPTQVPNYATVQAIFIALISRTTKPLSKKEVEEMMLWRTIHHKRHTL